jgi:hypothetical protein
MMTARNEGAAKVELPRLLMSANKKAAKISHARGLVQERV